MKLSDFLFQFYSNNIFKKIISASSEKLEIQSKQKLLRLLKYFAKITPFYRNMYRENRIDISDISTIDDFKNKIPIVDKNILFQKSELKDLLLKRNLNNVHILRTSSGSTNNYSFRFESRKNNKSAEFGVEFLINKILQIPIKKTLFINTLALGYDIPTRNLQTAITGVSAESVCAIIMKFKDEFNTFILIGESMFLKHTIEKGIEWNVPWKHLKIHIISGAEFISYNYGEYITHLTGIDIDNSETGTFVLNYGITELDTTLFFSNFSAQRLRKLIYYNNDLKKQICGNEVKACPQIMQYSPTSSFLETIKNNNGPSELLVTILNKKSLLPMIRYNTGDNAELFPFKDLKSILTKNNYQSYIPNLPLPIGLVNGRSQRIYTKQNDWISPNEIKEALFYDFQIAEQITGNFKILEESGNISILIQLKTNFKSEEPMKNKINNYLEKYINYDFNIKFLSYFDFPYGIEHNFCKKNQYV